MNSERTSLIVAALAILAGMSCAGCSADEKATNSANGSCPAELIMGGHKYTQQNHTEFRLAAQLDQAQFTDCNDGAGAQSGGVPARALEGVDPGTAFAAKLGEEWQLYVAKSADVCSVPYTDC